MSRFVKKKKKNVQNFRKLQKESEVAQACPTLCDPMDCSSPGFSIHGIFQARVLEWVAISFPRGSSQPRDQTRVSRIAGFYRLSHQGIPWWIPRKLQSIYQSVKSSLACFGAFSQFLNSLHIFNYISLSTTQALSSFSF